MFYAHSFSEIRLTNCYFQDNFGLFGGIAYITDDGFLNCSKSTFVNNSGVVGNIFYFINTKRTSNMDELTFENNVFRFEVDKLTFVKNIVSNSISSYSSFDSDFL